MKSLLSKFKKRKYQEQENTKNVLVPFVIGWEKSCRGEKDKIVHILQIFQYLKL